MDVLTVDTATLTRQVKILAGSADEEILDRLGRELRDDRHRVVTTRRAGRLLFRALDNRFDLAVVDLDLEDLDGVETVRILRRARPELPVIVVTAGLNERTRRQLAAEGVVRFLRKPFGYEDLRQGVDAATSTVLANSVHNERGVGDEQDG